MSVEIFNGDCRDVLSLVIEENSVDAIVTDPPYELTQARPGGRSEATRGKVMGGFMGMQWDGTGVAFDPATWRECLRVLKPGGHLLAFGGTRTYHRMVCAIEDAGFEIRDQIGWAYGSGFPKSLNGEWGGTALKPAWEPICVARKPLIGTVKANWLAYGTGGLNIDGCRVPATDGYTENRVTQGGGDHFSIGSDAKTRGTTFEPNTAGRWPANLIHDGSDEVLAAFPDAPGQIADASTSTSTSTRKSQNVYGEMKRGSGGAAARNDAGSAARFFYCAKASKKDRGEGNTHPTVKPTELMRYLCRLVTPAGGVVLDPFMGSGSTGRAAVLEGFRFIGCELQPEYVEISRRRIAEAQA